MTTLLTCSHCGEPIGVYEPAVFVLGNRPHRSSEAADPSRAQSAQDRYHDACYALLGGRSRADRGD